MTFLIPDRNAVAQLKYQLRRFEKQCAELPESTQLRIQQEMQGLRSLLGEHEPDRCTDYGGHCHYGRPLCSTKLCCLKCGAPAPVEEQKPGAAEPWTYEGAPSLSGWYAARWSWDAQEGVHCGACYWTGSAWAENFPVVAWHGPLQDSAAAYKYADDNDPDSLGGV